MDEGLAEQDAASLFEVRSQMKSVLRNSFKLGALFIVCPLNSTGVCKVM